jgi:hypothetical protein
MEITHMEIFNNIPIKNYSELRHEIKSGDILLCSGNSVLSNMIKQATHSVWSHVAFILRLDSVDRIMILESVESIGVRAVTLSHYINDYNGTGKSYPGHLMIARHHDMKQENIKNLSKIAIDLLGHHYNTQEIIRIAARISMNYLSINANNKDEITQSDFICSEYVYECFKSIGIDIEYDRLGFIAPGDFVLCPKISPLAFIETEDQQLPSKSRDELVLPQLA